jgi:hypothetical protein
VCPLAQPTHLPDSRWEKSGRQDVRIFSRLGRLPQKMIFLWCHRKIRELSQALQMAVLGSLGRFSGAQ